MTFSRCKSVPRRVPHTPVLSINLDATGWAAVMAAKGPVDEAFSGDLGQAQHVFTFSIGKQRRIRSDLGTVKFQLQTAVEIQPQNPLFRFTRQVRHYYGLLLPIKF